MFGSIYVGLSGLSAYSRGLQQVSNNVTNMNSSGFKGATVSFTDLVSINGKGGLSYSGEGGGGGNGVSVAGKQLDFRQGDLRQTGSDLDLAVDGNGFMMLHQGDQVFYTRTGSFAVDDNGFIVLEGTDYRLATLDGSGKPVSLSIDAASAMPPQQTTSINFSGNLSSTATTFAPPDVKVYDKTGAEHVWKIQFAKSSEAGSNHWTVTITDGKNQTVGSQTLKFQNSVVDPATSKLVFSDDASGLSITLDFSGNVTSFSGGQVSTLGTSKIDGYKPGTLTSVGVNSDGKLEIKYSNGQKKALGSVAIADFRNPQALEQRSGGLFSDTGGAQREVLTSEDDRVGRVMSRRLEASNVDLAKQFGDLILIQRGFQASSQIISIANDMIQQLFGIRGQG